MKKKQKTGRKPVEPSEKVILVGFYVRQKVVDANGGMDKLREKCKNAAETTFQNTWI